MSGVSVNCERTRRGTLADFRTTRHTPRYSTSSTDSVFSLDSVRQRTPTRLPGTYTYTFTWYVHLYDYKVGTPIRSPTWYVHLYAYMVRTSICLLGMYVHLYAYKVPTPIRLPGTYTSFHVTVIEI